MRILIASSFAGSSRYIEPLLPILYSNAIVCLVADGVGADVLVRDGIVINERVCGNSMERLCHIFDVFMPDVVFVVSQYNSRSLEKSVLKEGKKRRIRTISGIDHWSFYTERFSETDCYGKVIGDSLCYLPDVVIVNDQYAVSDLVATKIPLEKVFVGGSPVLEQRWEEPDSYVKSIEEGQQSVKLNNAILFISEPHSVNYPEGSVHYQGFTEFDVIRDIIDVKQKGVLLMIKLHPSQASESISSYIDGNDDCSLCEDGLIDDVLLSVDKIVGMGSMLLLEIALIRDSVVSYRPNERIEFIGNRMGFTEKVTNKDALGQSLKQGSPFRVDSLNEQYKDSSRKITNCILDEDCLL